MPPALAFAAHLDGTSVGPSLAAGLVTWALLIGTFHAGLSVSRRLQIAVDPEELRLLYFSLALVFTAQAVQSGVGGDFSVLQAVFALVLGNMSIHFDRLPLRAPYVPE